MSHSSCFLMAGIVLLGAGIWASPARPESMEPVSSLPQASVVCADGDTLKGIDVSYFAGEINWSSVAADGIVFAYIRVSNGLSFSDPRFSENWTGAAQAGIVRGAFQMLRADEDALAQAQLFIDTIGELAPGDLPPALAVESIDGQNPATITAKVGEWLDYVENALGLPPVIYTGAYFWEDSVASSDFSDHPFWIAYYTNGPCPLLPSQWNDWVFWQNSSTGVVAGINGNVPTNVFNGDLAALAELGKPLVCGDKDCVFENGFEAPESPSAQE